MERRDAAASTLLSLAEAVFLLAAGKMVGGLISLAFALAAFPYYTLAKRTLGVPLAPANRREALCAYGVAMAFSAAHTALFYFGWTRTGIALSLVVALVMSLLLWAAPWIRSLEGSDEQGGDAEG